MTEPNQTTASWLRGLGTLQGTPPAFDVHSAPGTPEPMFLDWLHAAVAAGVAEPHVATLSTVDDDGVPDARALIVRDVGPKGWAVAGPRDSAKASQLAHRPVAALSFWWQPIMRAVRLRGAVHPGTPAEIAADVAARPVARTDAANWMLWWIAPSTVEFWQGRVDRNHTRLVYRRSADGWVRSVTGSTDGARVTR